MIGDNDCAFNSRMSTHRKACKRYAALLFHRVIEDIAAKIISYHFINRKINPSGTLSKH